ncbi:hypothetical protein [Sporomusa acidovorans]|uniref:hypothetical protein n=1 Tax=Sporomusa acidovorans TaxID=112900 RepID=UPI00146C934D|nr:hypothetical protein [Sporomusa acidovorans]
MPVKSLGTYIKGDAERIKENRTVVSNDNLQTGEDKQKWIIHIHIKEMEPI